MFLNKAANPGYFTHGRNLLGSINRGVNRSAALQSYGRLAGEEAHKSLQHWSQMPDVEIFESISRFVHRVIVRCMMGEDFYDHHVDELYDLLQQMESLVGHPFNLLLPSWVPHLPGRQLAQARNRFAEIFRERLAARQLESDVWRDSLDYINYTLNDPRTAQLADYYPSHHVVLMFAAHTSTVASIAWTIVEVSLSTWLLRKLDLTSSYSCSAIPYTKRKFESLWPPCPIFTNVHHCLLACAKKVAGTLGCTCSAQLNGPSASKGATIRCRRNRSFSSLPT